MQALVRRRFNKALRDSAKLLDFSDKRIGVEGARALADALRGNMTLTLLNLWNSHIGAEGARALADVLRGNTALTHISLGYNQIGDDGARALADALRVNTNLISLCLHGNQIGDEGAFTLAEALRFNGILTHLYLRGNYIGTEGARALADVLEDGNSCTLSEDDMRDCIYEHIGCFAANVLRRYVRGGNRTLKYLCVDEVSPATCQRIRASLQAPYRHKEA